MTTAYLQVANTRLPHQCGYYCQDGRHAVPSLCRPQDFDKALTRAQARGFLDPVIRLAPEADLGDFRARCQRRCRGAR